MGREVWIYRLHQSTKLRELLKNNLKNKPSFEQFLSNRRITYGDSYDISYQLLLEKTGVDLRQLSPRELFEILYWLEEGILDEVPDVTLLEEAGIDLLYKSSTKSEANILMPIFYESLETSGGFDADTSIFDEAGVRLQSKDFRPFLDHLLIQLSRMNIQDGDANSLYWKNHLGTVFESIREAWEEHQESIFVLDSF